MWMVLRIFFADVMGKVRMEYYKLKKNIAFRWNLLSRHGIACYICQIQN